VPPSSHPELYGTRLTPHQVGALRYQIERLVERALADMQAVLDGTKEASPQQVALFLKLLDKVLPHTRKAPKEEPETEGTSWVRSPSAADLQRLLGETLGEAPPAPAPPPAPTKAELTAERERQYQQSYRRQHPQLQKRRAAAHARRYSSKKQLGERIKARKASEPPEGPWTREQDDAARRALQSQVAKEKRREAEREIRRTLEIMSAQDRPGGCLGRYAAGGDLIQDRYLGTCAEGRKSG
jgi:hypothetical protein